jgi:hypothetical protein
MLTLRSLTDETGVTKPSGYSPAYIVTPEEIDANFLACYNRLTKLQEVTADTEETIINLIDGRFVVLSLEADTEIDVIGEFSVDMFFLVVVVGGEYELTEMNGTKWADGKRPSLSAEVGDEHHFRFRKYNGTWYADLVGNNYAVPGDES